MAHFFHRLSGMNTTGGVGHISRDVKFCFSKKHVSLACASAIHASASRSLGLKMRGSRHGHHAPVWFVWLSHSPVVRQLWNVGFDVRRNASGGSQKVAMEKCMNWIIAAQTVTLSF